MSVAVCGVTAARESGGDGGGIGDGCDTNRSSVPNGFGGLVVALAAFQTVSVTPAYWQADRPAELERETGDDAE